MNASRALTQELCSRSRGGGLGCRPPGRGGSGFRLGSGGGDARLHGHLLSFHFIHVLCLMALAVS